MQWEKIALVQSTGVSCGKVCLFSTFSVYVTVLSGLVILFLKLPFHFLSSYPSLFNFTLMNTNRVKIKNWMKLNFKKVFFFFNLYFNSHRYFFVVHFWEKNITSNSKILFKRKQFFVWHEFICSISLKEVTHL